MHRHSSEGASLDATTARSRRQGDESIGVEGLGEDEALMRDGLAVAAQGGIRTIKHRGGGGVPDV